VLTIALLAWAITLWQRGGATTGDVVLVCTLGISILSATRDLAVALVDVTQHVARLTEAIATCCCRTNCAITRRPSRWSRAARRSPSTMFRFVIPAGLKVFDKFSLRLQPASGSGWSVSPAAANPACSCCCSASTTCRHGSITIDGQDISRVTQQSLREAISVVPQDISLFHRSIMENIRYGRPTATDDEVLRAAIAARCDFVETLPEGWRPWSAIAASSFPAASGSASPSPARSSRTRRSCCSMKRPPRSTANPRRRSAKRWARLMRGRTVIAIAHRLATLRNFDRVVMLKGGQDHRRRTAGSPDAGPGARIANW
jgi:ATP-binding cassette subfamily B protein